MNLNELIKIAAGKMSKLLDTAKAEGRDLTDEETKVFEDLGKEIDRYKNMIEKEARVTAIKDELSKTVTDPPRAEVGDTLKNKFSSLGEMLNAVKQAYSPSGRVDNRLVSDSITNAGTGMSVNVGSDGGFMVQPQFVTMLMDSIMKQSALLPNITMIPIGKDSNGITLPALAETSRADGYRFGGVRAYWANEGGTVTATKPTIREIDLKLSKLLAFCYMTEELSRDSSAMEVFIKKAYADEMSFKIDDAIMNGLGAGNPLGIMKCPALVTVAKEAGQKADTIVYENIVNMWSRMPARSRMKAVWLINQEIEPQLYSMSLSIGTAGVPVYMPAGGISGAQYGSLFGRPVLPIEQAAKLGDLGDIVVADLSDYIGIDKGGLEGDSSIHVQFLYDENVFRFRYRFNGTPYTNSPIATKANASFTLSPYVTLAAR